MSYVAVLIAASVPVALGLLVVRRSGQRRIGWLLVAQGVSVGLLLGGAQAAGSGTAALIVDQLAAGSWIFLFLWLVLIAYLLPDGRTLSHGWLWWIRAGLVGSLLFLVGAAGDRSTFLLEHDGADPPLRWLPQSLSGVLGTVGLVLVVLLFLGSFVAVRSRLRRSAGRERLQLLWLVWGALAVPLGLLVLWVNYFALGAADWLTTVVLTLVSVALPATIAVAILRYNLFDVRLALTRTLTYGALVVGVVAAYALVLYAAERMGGNGNAGGLAAVAIVAVAVHPAYAWLRERIERWVYGYRSQPYQALRLLADRADAADPNALSTAITDAVTEALRVHRVWVDAGGPDHEGVVRTALIHRGERLGYLAVEVPSGRTLSAADLSLLQDLARYAAVLVRAQRQADELRESRTRIVAGREEERRRLRRDLHDGVGPTLAAVVLTLNAAEAREDAGQRGVLLAEAREQVRDAISEVRRLVDDLRPPAIDEVGLLAAIRQRAAALSGGVTIEVSGPDPMPDLPAAVEVAAFRIASEAMANVARHSRASRCQVNVGVNGSFEMTIADNGRGADPGHGTRWGVGWTSMRERAAELGGRCSITEHAQGGLVVRVVVPLEHPQTDDSDMEGDA